MFFTGHLDFSGGSCIYLNIIVKHCENLNFITECKYWRFCSLSLNLGMGISNDGTLIPFGTGSRVIVLLMKNYLRCFQHTLLWADLQRLSYSSSLSDPVLIIMHCYQHRTQNPHIVCLQTGSQLYKSDVISHLEGEQLLRGGIGFLQGQSPGELPETVLQ